MSNIVRHEPRNELTVHRFGELTQELARLTKPLSIESELFRKIGWIKREWIEDWRERQTYGDEHGMGPPKVVPTLDTEVVNIRAPKFDNDLGWGPDEYRIGLYQQVLDRFDAYMTTDDYHQALAIAKHLDVPANPHEIKRQILRLFAVFPSSRNVSDLYTPEVMDVLTSEIPPFSTAAIVGGFAQIKREPIEFIPPPGIIYKYVKEAEEKFQAISKPLMMLAARRQQYVDFKTRLETNYVTKEEYDRKKEEARKNREKEAAAQEDFRRMIKERRLADELQQFKEERQKLEERRQLLERLDDLKVELHEAQQALEEDRSEQNFRRLQEVISKQLDASREEKWVHLPIYERLGLLNRVYFEWTKERDQKAARLIAVSKEIRRLEVRPSQQPQPQAITQDNDDVPPF